MNDSNPGGTKDAGNAELKGLPARVIPDEPAQGTRPKLRALPAGPTPQASVAPVGELDRKIKQTRREVANYENEIDSALRERDKALSAGEALIATMKSGSRTGARQRELKKLRNQYDGASERYTQALKERLKSRARLGALLVVRERWELEQDLCFHNPDDPARPLSREELHELLAGRDR